MSIRRGISPRRTLSLLLLLLLCSARLVDIILPSVSLDSLIYGLIIRRMLLYGCRARLEEKERVRDDVPTVLWGLLKIAGPLLIVDGPLVTICIAYFHVAVPCAQ